MYAGYSVPAVQQCAQMNQAYTQQVGTPRSFRVFVLRFKYTALGTHLSCVLCLSRIMS